MDEAIRPEAQSQPCPSARDKRKRLSKTLDLGNLPSRRGSKKAKHGSSKARVIKPGLPNPPSQQTPVQIYDLDSSVPLEVIPSKVTAPTSSQPPRIPMNLIKNDDLVWECFKKAVSGEDVAACYDMSLKDFEHSSVHDLFKVRDFLI